METIQSVKTNYDLVLRSFDHKNPYRSFSGRGQYICEVSLLYAKSKWSCGAETVKKLKVQIWPLTFWHKINRGPPQVKVNIYVKNHHCMSNGRGVIVQKPLFHRRIDRWTDRPLWWNQYTSTTSLAGVYKLIFNVEKSLKNDPPGSQNFMGGVTF